MVFLKGSHHEIRSWTKQQDLKEMTLHAHRPTIKKYTPYGSFNVMFNVQLFFLMLISKWTNNVSIKMLEIYEMNHYVNLQSPAINSTECVEELLLEREVQYSTVSCHCGWTVWNKSRFAWGRHSLQSPSAVTQAETRDLTHLHSSHTHTHTQSSYVK